MTTHIQPLPRRKHEVPQCCVKHALLASSQPAHQHTSQDSPATCHTTQATPRRTRHHAQHCAGAVAAACSARPSHSLARGNACADTLLSSSTTQLRLMHPAPATALEPPQLSSRAWLERCSCPVAAQLSMRKPPTEGAGEPPLERIAMPPSAPSCWLCQGDEGACAGPDHLWNVSM